MISKTIIKEIDENSKVEQFARDLYKECYFLIDSIDEYNRKYIIENVPSFNDEEIGYIKSRLLFLMRNNMFHEYGCYLFNIEKIGNDVHIYVKDDENTETIRIPYSEKGYSRIYSEFI